MMVEMLFGGVSGSVVSLLYMLWLRFFHVFITSYGTTSGTVTGTLSGTTIESFCGITV